jgi:hypothetical protein
MRAFLTLIASLFLCAAPSAACSMEEGYKIPTNFELVEKAKVIVLASVERVPASDEMGNSSPMSQVVTLRPLRFLKGSATANELGVIGGKPPKNWEGISTTTTLWQSHFSAGLGACIRQFYQPGELVVAMFDGDPRAKEITGKELNQLFAAWARVVETVDGPDDIWVHAVERYATIQAGDPATIKQRIESEAQQLRSVATPEAQAIAADLDYHLRRSDRLGTWGNFSMPNFTAASVPGQKGAQLYCIAGTPPGVMLASAPSPKPPRIIVDGVAYAATATTPTPAEQAMLTPKRILGDDSDKAEPLSIYRLSDQVARGALRTSVKNVSVEVDGKSIISGQPLDALLRWVSQCEKLQKLPAPTEEKPRLPAR